MSEETRGTEEFVAWKARRLRATWVRGMRMFKMSWTGQAGDYGLGPMPRWDGGTDASGRNHSPVWPDLARKILELGLAAEDLVKACFRDRGPQMPPDPSQLLSPATLVKYERRRAGKMDEMVLELRVQEGIARHYFLTRKEAHGWDTATAWRDTLMSVRNGLCPLYRYCGAALEGMADVAAFWRDYALDDYLGSRPEYDAMWGACIPDCLRREADQLTGGQVSQG